jgi:hypothetical protein
MGWIKAILFVVLLGYNKTAQRLFWGLLTEVRLSLIFQKTCQDWFQGLLQGYNGNCDYHCYFGYFGHYLMFNLGYLSQLTLLQVVLVGICYRSSQLYTCHYTIKLMINRVSILTLAL